MRTRARTRKRKRARINTYLDIAPLIDVVFLLLIFFLLTSSFIQQKGFEISLPGAVFSGDLAEQNLTVYIDSKENIMVGDKRVSNLRKIFETTNKPVVIKADKDVRLQVVTRIMDMAKASGVKNLSIATIIEDENEK